jgi:hypothetical protein
MKALKKVKKQGIRVYLNSEIKKLIAFKTITSYYGYSNEPQPFSLSWMGLSEHADSVNKSNNSNHNLFTFVTTTFYKCKLSEDNFDFDNHTLTNGDNLYFIPGSCIPRFKVKEKGEKVGFKTRKTSDNANVIIFDNKALSKQQMSMNRDSIHVSLSNFNKILNAMGKQIEDLLTPEQLLIIANDDDQLYVDNDISSLNQSFTNNDCNLVFPTRGWRGHDSEAYTTGVSSTEAQAVLDIIDDACNDPNKIILSSTQVLAQINDTSVISQEMYTRLSQMLNGDKNSVTLAMELLSNFDLKRSIFYVLLLIRDYNSKIRWSANYNHSNFKAFRISIDNLLNAGKDNLFNHGVRGTNVISLLGEAKLLKKEHVEHFKEDVKNSFSYGDYSKFFEVSNIVSTPVLKKMLEESAENLKLTEIEQPEEVLETEEHDSI